MPGSCEGIQGQTSCGKQEFRPAPDRRPGTGHHGALATGLVGLGLFAAEPSAEEHLARYDPAHI